MPIPCTRGFKHADSVILTMLSPSRCKKKALQYAILSYLPINGLIHESHGHTKNIQLPPRPRQVHIRSCIYVCLEESGPIGGSGILRRECSIEKHLCYVQCIIKGSNLPVLGPTRFQCPKHPKWPSRRQPSASHGAEFVLCQQVHFCAHNTRKPSYILQMPIKLARVHVE